MIPFLNPHSVFIKPASPKATQLRLLFEIGKTPKKPIS